MSIFDVTTQISTPLAAIAFAISAGAYYGYRIFRNKAAMIASAPPEDRARLVDKALETYSITEDNLTREQKYQLMLTVLNLRAKRFKILAITTSLLFAIAIGGIVGVQLISKENDQDSGVELISEKVIKK